MILQERMVFCNTLFLNVLECKDMSHSRNGLWQGFQNVLKSCVLEPLISRHSRMAEKCHLQNVFCSEIPFFLPFRNDQLQRFQNAQMLILQEWFVFCNTLFSNVLECRDMSHSRNGQRQGFQNVLKSRVLEPLISRHSRMAEKCHLQNVFCSEMSLFLPFRNG